MSTLNGGVMVQEYVYDFAVDGGAQGAIVISDSANKKTLPVGALIKNVYAHVSTACTSGGSATVKWGNAAGDFHGAVAVADLAANAVFNAQDDTSDNLLNDADPGHPILYRVDSATNATFIVTIATADLTAGKISFLVEYMLPAGI
jgi:hypothetical protein